MCRSALFALVFIVAYSAVAETGTGAAQLGKGDESSEYWDVTAVFDSGHRIFARFSITNEGPGDRTAYALGQIVFPDGRIVPFQNGRREGNWRLSDDGLRLKIGSSVLDLHGPARHFEVDKNKQGIKFFLDFERGEEPVRSWSDAPRGYHVDLVTLGAPIRGTIWVRGVLDEPVPVAGAVSLTHTWMDRSEPGWIRRRLEPHLLVSEDGQSHVYLLEVMLKKGEAHRWLVVQRGSEWHEAHDFDLMPVSERLPGDPRYPVPRALHVKGQDVKGNNVTGRIEMEGRILEHDPLSIAPRLFRWLLSFRTSPSQVWLTSKVSLEWSDPAGSFTVRGLGVSSFYFMNPMDDGR